MCITQSTKATMSAFELNGWSATAGCSIPSGGLTCPLPAVSPDSPCWVKVPWQSSMRKQTSPIASCSTSASGQDSNDGGDVERLVSDDEESCREMGSDGMTTVMIKGIPARCSQKQLLEAVDESGFQGQYVFFYMPTRRNACQNRGYAFMTMKDSETASIFCELMDGYSFKDRVSSKALSVTLAEHYSKAVGNARREERQNASAVVVQEPCGVNLALVDAREPVFLPPPCSVIPAPPGLLL
eukprot:TRINITY_DN882_c0_g2_i1.p1 TRINITY_DN882_c0_g2~~TRINITY_DN882_c0_g2_i1.p1  ORF type:complete len:241 (-),score=45.64 TRINITY_DN882_c0_g2_i1:77-799(-)